MEISYQGRYALMADNKRSGKEDKIYKDDIGAIIGRNLKDLIAANKTSQKELAERLHIIPSTVSDYCTGKRIPPVEFFLELKNIYQIDIDDMLTRSINPRSGQHFVPDVPQDPAAAASYERYCGVYILYYLDTGRYKGRDTQAPQDSLTYGILIVYKNPSNLSVPKFSSSAVLGFADRKEAEDLKKTLESLSDISKIEYINKTYQTFSYHGDFELSSDHAFISLDHSNTDKALIVIHRVDNDKSDYIGGIGTVNSVSRGRERAPVVQFMGISRFSLKMSVEEIHHCLLLNYPVFNLEDETDEIIRSFKSLYTEEGSASEGLTEYQKSVIVRSTLERLIKKNLERNMFRYGKISERDDDYWYHSIKDLSAE